MQPTEDGDDSIESLILASTVECLAHGLAAEIEQFLRNPVRPLGDYPEFYRHVTALGERDLTIEFRRLGSEAAFRIDGKAVVFNLSVAEKIYASLDEACDNPEKVSLFESILRLFMLHELRHITQGLASYDDVQALKGIGQDDLIAQYDFTADVDATKAFAVFQCVATGDLSSRAFIRSFKTGLYLHVFHCIPLFGFRKSKPAKMGRAMGLVLMLARLSLLERLTMAHVDTSRLRPVTDGLFVRPNDTFLEASIQWLSGAPALASVECEFAPGWLLDLADAIEAHDMERALQVALKYLQRKPQFWGP